MKRHTAVPGHGLLNEGAAFLLAEDGRLLRSGGGTGGPGRGVCKCGVSSAILFSAGERQRWHAVHKIAVRDFIAAMSEPSDAGDA